jgi:hypothetical protein
MGQLVTDSKFPAANPYSSQARLTGLEGLSPFFKEKPWIASCQDLNVFWEACGARAPKYWLLVRPSHPTPHLGYSEAVVEPTGGPAFERLDRNGPLSISGPKS